MTSEKDIIERFSPKHISELVEEDTEKLKKDIEEASRDKEPAQKDYSKDPRSEKVYTFDFHHREKNGRVWDGRFTNKILSIKDWQTVGIARSKMSAGLPYQSLDPLTMEINIMVSHLMFSLQEYPEWASDLRKFDSIPVLQEIYSEVASHEAVFHGDNPNKMGSEE